MRNLIAPLVLVATLGFSAPSLAKDIYLHKQTPEQLKSICEKVSGKFSQDKSGYACGTDCKGGPGTSCLVYCRPNKRCVAQVIGARHPRSVESALRGKKR